MNKIRARRARRRAKYGREGEEEEEQEERRARTHGCDLGSHLLAALVVHVTHQAIAYTM